MQRGQDSRLLPMVVETMAKGGLDFGALDRIVVTRGPGSFTGARVGLAAARGLGFAASKPVVGLDRFSLYHLLHVDKGKDLLVVIDSKRAELFCRFFPAASCPSDACLMTEADIDSFMKAHPGTELAGDRATPADDILKAAARLGEAADIQNGAFSPVPLYLRAPDVTVAKR